MREHRPVIAPDFPSFDEVKEFLALSQKKVPYLKVGWRAITQRVLRLCPTKGLGHSVF